MFGATGKSGPPPTQGGGNRARPAKEEVIPVRKFKVRRYDPLDPSKIEEVLVIGHQLEYAHIGVLAIHVAVEFEEGIVIQVQRVFNGYIDVQEMDAMMPAGSTLRESKLIS